MEWTIWDFQIDVISLGKCGEYFMDFETLSMCYWLGQTILGLMPKISRIAQGVEKGWKLLIPYLGNFWTTLCTITQSEVDSKSDDYQQTLTIVGPLYATIEIFN